MKLSNLDIVYVVKEKEVNEELRYSLRSVCKNFPHRKVWIFGGKPDDIMPDEYVYVKQTGKKKYDKVNNLIKEVCLEKRVTDNFILFNDDFFVMKPVENYEYHYSGGLIDYLNTIVEKFKNPTEYTGRLYKTMQALDLLDFDTKCYELHEPMLYNKHKLLEIYGVFPGYNGLRSLYGNYHNVKSSLSHDNKVLSHEDSFNTESVYLSTSDISFSKGKIGEFIRNSFPDKCKFEK